jgi:hypothetical protein
VGCLIGKVATSELASSHDCSLGVIMKGAGAPAHHMTPGPRAKPGLDVRETRMLQVVQGCWRGAFGVCIQFLSLIGLTVQVLGAPRDLLHPERTKHVFFPIFFY